MCFSYFAQAVINDLDNGDNFETYLQIILFRTSKKLGFASGFIIVSVDGNYIMIVIYNPPA